MRHGQLTEGLCPNDGKNIAPTCGRRSDANHAPNAAARVRMVNPAEWEGKQAPPRKWIVENYIPDGTVTLLYADGGTGKSYLKLQLAIARAVAREWIGLMPEPGRTLVLSTEDDITEMWRRIEGMLPFFGARMADLGDVRLVDLVGENSVLGLLQKGVIEPTPMYQSLDEFMSGFEPGLVCLDVLADLFSGEENNRAASHPVRRPAQETLSQSSLRDSLASAPKRDRHELRDRHKRVNRRVERRSLPALFQAKGRRWK
jgi:hypothetical protein